MQIDINRLSREYAKKNILVIGDIILDAYIYVKVDEISQEAPVPIVTIDRKKGSLTEIFSHHYKMD